MIKYYQSAILLNGYPVANCTFGLSIRINVCFCVYACLLLLVSNIRINSKPPCKTPEYRFNSTPKKYLVYFTIDPKEAEVTIRIVNICRKRTDNSMTKKRIEDKQQTIEKNNLSHVTNVPAQAYI